MPFARVPFAQPIESRTASTSKDARSVNAYFEARKEIPDVLKRPGHTTLKELGAGTGKGLYKCDSGYLWAVVGNSVYRIADTSLTSVASGTISSTSTLVYWAESGNDTYLFMHNTANGYTSLSNAAFVVVPTDTVGDTFVSTGGTGYSAATIVTFSAPLAGGVTATGTVLIIAGVVASITITNHGTTYSALDTITATITDGGGGTGAVVYAYLNGFPVPGTLVDGSAAALAPGAAYLDGYTVVVTRDGRLFNSEEEDPTSWGPLNYVSVRSDPDPVMGLVKHLNYIVVFGSWSTEFFYNAGASTITPGSPFLRNDQLKSEVGCADGDSIVQFRQAVMWVGVSKTFGRVVYIMDGGMTAVPVSNAFIERYLNVARVNSGATNKIRSHVFRLAGHTFYVMTLVDQDLTFVYDVDSKVWYQWTSYYSGAEHAYVLMSAVEFMDSVVALHGTTGNVVTVSTSILSDNGISIYWRIITTNLDSGTHKRKFHQHGEVIGDKVSATMSIRHSSNDYVSWSAWRTVNLNSPRSILWQLSQSRYRAYEFLVTDLVALRLTAFELNIEGGEQESDPQLA